MTNYKEILRLYSQGISQRGIASSISCSRNTVKRILDLATVQDITWPDFGGFSDLELEEYFYPKKSYLLTHKAPDVEWIHAELVKSGVTLSLLWHEYVQNCRIAKETPYKYTQFCKCYRDYVSLNKATMRIKRKPAEKLEVDWAGTTMQINDSITGDELTAYIFVSSMTYSGYSYVEATLDMKSESWINAHVNAFKYFKGITKILVPDNCKTAVIKNKKYEDPILNKSYQELAEYYQTIIIPARVRKPKDKSTVEGVVGIVTTWIIAALRNQQFFSLNELNDAIKEKLELFNNKDFQKKEGSRKSLYLNEEQGLLIPLPTKDFELSNWKIATVQLNYHISIEKMHYSVPYEYLKHKVDVRMTKRLIEVFYKSMRIASHLRLYGRIGQYCTNPDHMPDNHKKYLEWDSERFIGWAAKIGPNTKVAIKALLAAHKIEQQSYKSCLGLLKLADKYSPTRLECACERALYYSPQPSYRSIKTILTTGSDQISIVEEPNKTTSEHGFTRGSDYYRGK